MDEGHKVRKRQGTGVSMPGAGKGVGSDCCLHPDLRCGRDRPPCVLVGDRAQSLSAPPLTEGENPITMPAFLGDIELGRGEAAQLRVAAAERT